MPNPAGEGKCLHSDRPDVARLPRAIRDLVALSGVPAARVAREPAAVAAGFADVMRKLFDLGFVIVRLHDSNGRVAAHFARESACLAVGHRLQDCLSEGGRLSRMEIVPSIGDDAQGGRGIVIPVGIDVENALVSAACDRPDFPGISSRAGLDGDLCPRGNRVEELLMNHERELHLLVETIPALVWRAGPDGNIEYVNQRVLEYFGAPLGEIIGWGWAERVHPDDVAFKVRTWLENLGSGSPHEAACRFRGADGRYRWFAVRGEPLRASDGSVLSWYGLLLDIDDRNKAEEALRESEYKLRQITDTVPGLIWSAGPDGEPTHVSQRLLDYSGMRFEEFKHTGWKALVHPDDVAEVTEAYQHAFQGGTSYRGVLRLRRADGEFRWHHARCEPLRDRQGRIIQWYGLSVDIDEAKKAEEQPRSAAQLKATLNVIPAYTWYAAPSGGLTFVNKRTADYLGLPKDHPLRFGIDIGAQWDAHIPLLHPDDHEGSRKAWSTCLRTGEAGEFSFRVRNAQGDYRWFLTRVEPLLASDGTLLQWVGVNLDIEELKCAEQALRESEYNLRQIIETVPCLLWSTEPDGEPTHVTQRILDYIGMQLEDYRQRGWETFLHPDDLPETAKAFHQAIQTGTSYEAVHRLRRSDGEYRWHHARGEPLRDRQGRIIQWYGLSVDIDDGKRAEDQLRRSEAHLAEAQRLSHTGSAVYNDTTVLYWSDETYRIFELDPLKGLPSREAVLQRIHPDDRERATEVARRAVRRKRDYRLEYRILLPAGTIKHIELAAHPKFSASGELIEVVSTLIDVTERKRAEQALRESEGKLRDYADTASDWFWEIGPDYRFTMLTENAFGSDSADRIDTICWDHALDLETEPEKWRALRATLDARRPFRDFVYRSARGDGTPIYVKASGKPVFDASGGFRGYRGTGTDVTAIMRAQEALRESERNSRSAIDGIAGLLTIMAPDGEVETVNRQCLEYFGRSLEWIKDWGNKRCGAS